MTVSVQTTYNTYTGNGVATVFPFQFKILAAADLAVYVAGALKTPNVDYTVAGVGADVGGSVTFTSAPGASLAVSVIRMMSVRRTTDYQQLGDFLTPVVNPDFDNPILLVQDLTTQLGRSIRTPADEVGTLPTLPSITLRAGKFMGFDAGGLPIALSGTGADAALRTDLAITTAGTEGALLVGTRRPETGSIARSVANVLRELPLTINDFGASVLASGATNRAAIVAAAAAAVLAGRMLTASPGTYPLAGAVINLPGGIEFVGPGIGHMQQPLAGFARAAGDFNSFFQTDSTTSSFLGITFANWRIQGGPSATWSDIAAKWAFQSHLPFTKIYGIHIEDPTANQFFGNGIRLHNDNNLTNGGSMGAWLSKIDSVRYVGTPGVPQANGQIGLDMYINGGAVSVTHSCFEKCDIPAWVRAGDNISFDDVTLQSAFCGPAASRTSAALIVGVANAARKVTGFSFRGYMEGVARAALFQNCRGAKIFGSYMNAVRAFSPSGGADGFITLESTCEGFSFENSHLQSQYNLPSLIYSKGAPFTTEGNFLFLNVTNSAGTPQPFFGGGIYENTRPFSNGDITVKLTNASTSAAIANVSASGSLVKITKVAHGLATGRRVWIEGILGTVGTAIDGINGTLWQITVVDADNFTLDGSLFAGAYTSGGNFWLPTVETGAESGSVVVQLTGCATAPTGTLTWLRSGRTVTVTIPTLTAVSTTGACTLIGTGAGIPLEILPATLKRSLCRAVDNGVTAFSMAAFDSAVPNTVTLLFGPTGAAFTAAGTKGSSFMTMSYSLD